MKKNIRSLFVFLIISLFYIVGCSTDEADFDSFSLEIVGLHGSEDEGTPYLYIVNPEEARGEIGMSTSIEISPGVFDSVYESFDLEKTSVSDEEIIIGFDGEELIFTRLSESVVVNENKIQYQYRSLVENE